MNIVIDDIHGGLVNGTVGIVAAAETVMTATVADIHLGVRVEQTPCGIVAVDREHPAALYPRKRAEEVGCGHIAVVLPAGEHEAQVGITTLPVDAEEVGTVVHAEQVVEIDLIDILVLCAAEVELVGHLVGEEESLVASLVVSHC